MISRIFIDRPIFAWVVAIIIMLAGLGAIYTLPVEHFPDISPPNVNIQNNYPGASAETLENSVAQVMQVQNKVQQALPRLPQQVQQQGLTVTKSNPDFLLIAAIADTSDRTTNQDVSDYLVSNLQDSSGRLQGVVRRDCEVTVAFSTWSVGLGVPPISPAATSVFCAVIAFTTSPGIRL